MWEILLAGGWIGLMIFLFVILTVVAPLAIWIHAAHMRALLHCLLDEQKKANKMLSQHAAMEAEVYAEMHSFNCPECGAQIKRPAKRGQVMCPKCQAILELT